MAKTCVNSGCTADGTKRCASCNQASYCSRTCQKQDWRHHKSACKKSTTSSAKAPPYYCDNLGCLARPDQVIMPCPRCIGATYCSMLCVKEHREDHNPHCHLPTNIDVNVKAVMIHSQKDGGGRYSEFLLPRDDPIFKTKPAMMTGWIGCPLLVHRPQEESVRGPLSDNPHAAWLMTRPTNGLVPIEWQGGVGNVIVARADGGTLEAATLGAITDYISEIKEIFEYTGIGAAMHYYDRDRLYKYIADHLKMQQDFKRLQLEGMKELAL